MRYLLQPVMLCIRYFPQLAACYLLGYLGRTGAIEVAASAMVAALPRAGSMAADVT